MYRTIDLSRNVHGEGRVLFMIAISRSITGELPNKSHVEQLAENYHVELNDEFLATIKKKFPAIEL